MGGKIIVGANFFFFFWGGEFGEQNCLMVVYICTKFRKNILDGLKLHDFHIIYFKGLYFRKKYR